MFINRQNSGMIGVGLKPTDYSFNLSTTQQIPKNEFGNFAKNKITFNQGSSYACTIFSAFTLLANKFNLPQITNEFILDKWNNDVVPNYGANPKVGWYISSAVDYVRNWFNSQPELVLEYGKLVTAQLTLPYSWNQSEYKDKIWNIFNELTSAGHDFCGGHNGSSEYNTDFKSDGILDLKKLSNVSYSHAICMSLDILGILDLELDYLVANSWKGVNNNVYRLQYIQELIDNNVLFPTVYTFFSERDEIVFSGKDYTANIENELVKRFNNSYVMLSESTGAIYDVRGDKLISVDKFFKDKDSRENLIKTYEPINLLTGVSDDNFYTMVK